MDIEEGAHGLHQLDFSLSGLASPAVVTIELATAAEAEMELLVSMPCVQIGAAFGGHQMQILEMKLQPRRIQFQVANPPPILPISLQVTGGHGFLFGRLQVTETVQATISTAAEQVRIVGPGYWAVPVLAPSPARAVATVREIALIVDQSNPASNARRSEIGAIEAQ